MKKRIALVFIIIMIFLLTGCTGNGVYKKSSNSVSTDVYKKEMAVKIPDLFLEGAQQIETIDDSLSYGKTYVKETDTEYYCFNMESFLVCLFFDERAESDSLETYLDMFYDKGLRLAVGDGMVSGTEFMDKPKAILETVYCEAILSQELYEDFTGKAAVIKDTHRTICLFVGAKGRELELGKEVTEVLDDVIYSMTTTKDAKQQILDSIVITDEIVDGGCADVAILNEYGNLESISLDEVSVLTTDEMKSFNGKLKEAPSGYEWCMVKLVGEKSLANVHIKVKDSDGNYFETGGRTYTVSITDKSRIDAYLVPKNSAYTLEFGNIVKFSVFKVR